MRKILPLVLFLTLSTGTVAMARNAQPLPDDLEPVRISGSAGPLLTWREARPILMSGEGPEAHIVGAAGTLGRGRMVALGHESFMASEADAGLAFLESAARWAGGGGAVIVDERFTQLAAHLEESGLAVKPVGNDWLASLDGKVVAIVGPGRIGEQGLGQIRRHVGRGGGLITGSPGWGWQQLNPDKSLRDDSVLNALFHAAGIAWLDEAVGGGPFAPVNDASPLLHVADALDAVEGHQRSRTPLEPAQLRTAVSTIIRAADGLPTREASLRPRIDRLLLRAATAIPTPQAPLGVDQPLERAALQYQVQKQLAAPPDEVSPHPAADTFPGAVPDDAPRVTQSLSIDLREPGWKSTGLYAAPGETLTVTSPSRDVARGLQLQIGCHTDRNWRLDKWTRVPEITIRRDLGANTTELASPFGGPLYVLVPEGADGQINVEVAGAVEAPMFVLGKTSLEEWNRTIRHHPAPWAELVGQDIILSIPSQVVRDLEDPEQLMAWWDKVVQVQEELSPRPNGVTRPERIVTDQQIVAGYMHAGYPIMTWLDVTEAFVDYDRLSTEGNWGIFHEVGHNFQWPQWTFDGTGEVTNNIFALYTYDRLLPGLPDRQKHPALLPQRRAGTTAELQSTPEGFKQDPFFALYMYMHVVEDFGWDPFKAFFAEFPSLPPDQRPRTDQAERDRWLTRLSHHTGHNLAPLFTRWGVETSQQARDEVAHLPVYEPSIDPPPADPAGELMQ